MILSLIAVFSLLTISAWAQEDVFVQRFPKEGAGAVLTGGYLKWQAHRASPTLTSPWGSGFRVGLGYQHLQRPWEIGALFTQFRSSGHWRLKYMTLDVACYWLRFPFEAMAIRPFLGLRGAHIEQHVKADREELRAAGPLLGTDVEFAIWQGIALYSSFWGSALFGSKNAESLSLQAGLKGVFPLYLKEAVLSGVLCYERTRWNQLHALVLQGVTLAFRVDF